MTRLQDLSSDRTRALLAGVGGPALGAAGAAAAVSGMGGGPLSLALAAAVGAAIPGLLRSVAPPGDALAPSDSAETAHEAPASAPAATAPPPRDQDDARALTAPDPDRRALLPGHPTRAAAPRAVTIEPQECQAVLDVLPAGLLLLDDRGRVLFANEKAIEELGRAPNGMELTLLLRSPQLMEALTAAYSDLSPTEVSFSMHGAQERTLFATLMPMTTQDGATRMIVLLQDQTRIRRAEQLHRDFVANASHELKTPLAAISGFIETLRSSAKDDPDARDRFLGIMAQQSERMRLLIVDLMSLNRIELNEHIAPRDRIALGDVVDAAVRHVTEATSAARAARGEAGEAPAPAIEIDLPEDSPVVLGDRSELTQALANLIDNALTYGGQTQPPRVSVRIQEGARPRVALAVQDFGAGIAREHIPRLTERFYRVGSDPFHGKTGTGLGLAIVKHVAARHRGELVIDSRLGHGSRFTLLLPLAP